MVAGFGIHLPKNFQQSLLTGKADDTNGEPPQGVRPDSIPVGITGWNSNKGLENNMLPRIWNRWFNRLLKKSAPLNKITAKAPKLEKLE